MYVCKHVVSNICLAVHVQGTREGERGASPVGGQLHGAFLHSPSASGWKGEAGGEEGREVRLSQRGSPSHSLSFHSTLSLFPTLPLFSLGVKYIYIYI